MKTSLFALVSTAFVAAVSAWTQPQGASPQGNPISKPGLGDIVPVGKPYTITWTPTSAPDTVTLLFLKGPAENVIPQFAIAEKIPNTGSYTWIPPTDIQDGETGYGIQLIDDVTGFYQYTTQFGISNKVVVSSSPIPSSTVEPTTATPAPTTKPVEPTTTTTTTTPAAPTTTDDVEIEDATTVLTTAIVTITSCAPTVSNCPGKPATTPVTEAPVSSSIKTASWSNSTMATSTTSSGVASTGFGTSASATATGDVFTGAGANIRVGCAMGAVLVATLALAL